MEGWQLALLAVPAGVFVLSVVMVIRKLIEIQRLKRGATPADFPPESNETTDSTESTDEDPRRALDAPPVLTEEDPRRAK